jgi:hypothetical protein
VRSSAKRCPGVVRSLQEGGDFRLRRLDGWSTLVDVVRTGRRSAASRIGSRIAFDRPTHVWVSPRIGPFAWKSIPAKRRGR